MPENMGWIGNGSLATSPILVGALAVQMACTHMAAMAVLGKLDSGFGPEPANWSVRINCGSPNEGVYDANGIAPTLA
jgi:hypothetical protein